MFQPPVNNLEKIRKARKRVKQLLLQIGLDTCREAYEGYRSKQFCCSLCKFSTRLLSSFKSHLHRYHEEEKDQEIMATCPRCPFTSYTKNVVRHMRIFHSSVRKVPSPGANDGQNASWSKDYPKAVPMKFACVKCSFTDSLYYTIKRHVLTSHHKSELKNYFGEKSEEELKETLGLKVNLDNRFYCKKCNYTIHNQDALMYHILTSDKHRDLEQKLRTDISDAGRSSIKRPYKKFSGPPIALSPKPTLPISPAVTPPCAQDAKAASLPQNGPNKPLLGASTAIISNIMPSITSVPDPAGGLVKTSTTVAPTAQVGFVTTSLSQNQTITLPQSMFLSPRFTLNQPVTATMLPSACGVGGQIITGAQTTVRPINQSLTGGLLSVNQSTMLTCPRPLQPNVIQVNQTGRPTVISVNQPLKPTNVAGNQPGLPQNTFLATPIIRQLIPTGKQVNGIPTYTLITLPVTPCAMPAVTSPVNPPKVPAQLSQPEKVFQASTSPASAPSSPVVQVPQSTSQKTPPSKRTSSNSPAVAPGDIDKKTKQWKTCPVCNELFPSNVYEVHMQIAHIKQENSPNRPTESATSNETKQPVVAAAHASFFKVVKEKSIRCVTCKVFTEDKEVLHHLLMHGMVCLYCKAVFYELRNFIYHMKILHVDQKKIHGDFVRKGITVSCDNNGTAQFPHFDFTFNVSKEELGEKEMHIAVVTGANSNTATPLYVKIQTSPERSITDNEQGSKCSFCDHVLSKSESLETHLKDRHHIMPTMHTILKSPAFKCIHCCGVYTGSMTLSAIALHLQRCRNAPKDSIAALELCLDSSAKGQSKGGTNDSTKGKPSSTDTQVASNDTKIQKNGLGASQDLSPVLSKRRRLDSRSEFSDYSADQNVSMLVMVPDSFATVSHEAKKEFLLKYFHVKPYPSKKEIELLAHVLDMWRSDVASFFGTRRYICMKFLKNHQQQVLLGFKMEDLKQVKHDIELSDDY
ncbi:PREDICTED: ADNP homeobox protein 2 isoform X2 [Nanorana parkeri]|uniref:ADNP homeobox protein 2 isoform X2 n=1 Tax=Nanorana parkeri TaxID=125878 RepID=UPI0008546923|nr:PREDICTED: ADNP homeobox protein 2 isoform X2 [Nanorana parkeri]